MLWKRIPAGMAPEKMHAPATNGRLTGVDLARAVAVIGMLAVHFRPKEASELITGLHAIPHGRASVLFVLVAGVGIALLSARPEGRPRARLRLFSFALFLLPLGLWLQMFDHHVAVILQHYAAFYLLGIAVLGLSRKVLAGLAVAASIIGPMLYFVGRLAMPDLFDRESVSFGDTPLEVVVGLVASGSYPLLSWAGPLMAGIWLGRQDLRSTTIRRKLVVRGAAVALTAFLLSTLIFAVIGQPVGRSDWRFLFTDSPHTQMPLWIAGATGSAAMVLGASLYLADRFGRVLEPLVAMGRMALTIYVLHLLFLVAAGHVIRTEVLVPSIVAVAAFAAMAAVFALAWQSSFGRGPIERAMHVVWELMDATLPGQPRAGRRVGEQEQPATVPVGSRVPRS